MRPTIGIAHAKDKIELQERIDRQELEGDTAPTEERTPEEQLTDLARRIDALSNKVTITEKDDTKVVQAAAGFSDEMEDGSDVLVRVTVSARYRPVVDEAEFALESVAARWEAPRLRNPLFADEVLTVAQLHKAPADTVRLLGLIGQSIEGVEERSAEIATDELIRKMNEESAPPKLEGTSDSSFEEPFEI